MKKIYIDGEFKCHVENDVSRTEIETDIFDNKSKTFIEGYRYVPQGETWIREDGTEFHGEMIAPWKPYEQLAFAQANYEDGEDNVLTTIENLLEIGDRL